MADNPINASVVALLSLSLRKLAQQLADGERVEGPYDRPEEYGGGLLVDLADAASDLAAAITMREIRDFDAAMELEPEGAT